MQLSFVGRQQRVDMVLTLPFMQRISALKVRASPALMLYIELHFFVLLP